MWLRASTEPSQLPATAWLFTGRIDEFGLPSAFVGDQ